MAAPRRPRIAIVLSGGGARGAYEAGVLDHLFRSVYPRVADRFEFDIVSGTSVGAIHAAYVAASGGMPADERSERLVSTWRDMRIADVFRLSARDLIGIPLRALGVTRLVRRDHGERRVAVGGLVDLSPLEHIVEERIPWEGLRANLDGGRPGALCVSCTEIRSGRVTVFMDGPLSDPGPWVHDPNASALPGHVTPRHVRASAAIPFLFPAVRLGERYYVDGGLRMNTPLSPALRLGADRVVVIALKHDAGPSAEAPAYPEDVITQPAFLLGKVLNALLLDQMEYELQRIGLVNAWIEHGTKVYGDEFLDNVNVAVRAQRGADYRPVRVVTVRPSRDVGCLADECYRGMDAGNLGALGGILGRLARRGVPEGEGDLLSYLLFDRCFTGKLLEMGRADAAAREDELLALLGDD